MITQQLVLTALEKLFADCESPSMLKYLLEKVSFWKASPKIRQNILDSLDNVLAFSYQDEQGTQNLQFIIPTLAAEFSLNNLLACIEPGYILSNLVRAGCITQVDAPEGFIIDERINQRAVMNAGLFLEAFCEVGSKKQQVYFQKCIVDAMKDAAMMGNIAQFDKICEFACPNICADECRQYCFLLPSSEQRQAWLNENWFS